MKCSKLVIVLFLLNATIVCAPWEFMPDSSVVNNLNVVSIDTVRSGNNFYEIINGAAEFYINHGLVSAAYGNYQIDTFWCSIQISDYPSEEDAQSVFLSLLHSVDKPMIIFDLGDSAFEYYSLGRIITFFDSRYLVEYSSSFLPGSDTTIMLLLKWIYLQISNTTHILFPKNHINQFTSIPFSDSKQSESMVIVWNGLGQKVKTIVIDKRIAVKETVDLGVLNVPPGIYYVNFITGNSNYSTKVLYTR